MPNWCKGTLKVRGKAENVKKFVLEGVVPVDFFGAEKAPLKIDEYSYICSNDDCWIRGTRRGFIENLEMDFDYEDDENITEAFESRFAWGIIAEDLLEICKKYQIDMKIYGFECGMQFNQNIEIVNGVIIHNEEIEFDDYTWECVCPLCGG